VVTGLEGTHEGAPFSLDADLVVAANGRRSPLPDWLAPTGAVIREHEEDTGIVYFSQFHRLREGVVAPPRVGPAAGNLDYLKFGLFVGDNRTFSVTLACGTGDRELRTRLTDPATFAATAARIPALTPWMAPDLADPITPIEVMARLINRRRWFTDQDGRPLVAGLVAVGDAHTCTNPLYGRGCSLAMVQAVALVDALAAHGDAVLAAATDYEAASAREVLPWYRAAVAQDRMDRSRARAAGPGAAPTSASDAEPERDADEAPGDAAMSPDQIRALLRDGVMPALRVDAVVFRAFLRMFNLLTTPDALMVDPDVLGRVLAVYQDRENRLPEPVIGPGRDELLTSL
jgi:2-polyprenyl-6-methoxyphenol hydroxylase-like FAD-dependent oxidoreductase